MIPYLKTLACGFAPLVILLNFASAEGAEAALFDLDFSGGTPTEFAGAVEEALGRPFNLLIPESGQNLLLPAFRVKQVSLENLLPSLTLTENQVMVHSRFDEGFVRSAITAVGF